MPVHSKLRDIHFRPFTASHLEAAVDLSRAEGWPHRREDWDLVLSHSMGIVAMSGAKVVGTALVSTFGEAAMLNMIIVDRSQRGLGLGRLLVETAIDLAGPRELRLVATDEGFPLYQRLGFTPLHPIFQCQGTSLGAQAGPRLARISPDLVELARQDKIATGLTRRDLLTRIGTHGDVFATPDGFAVIREFGTGRTVGPIIASNLPSACALLAEAANRWKGQMLRIDTPDPALKDVAQELGLRHRATGTAMVLNQAHEPADTPFSVFALISQALG